MPVIEITSFGYLHGQAPDAHLTIDLRHHFRDPHVRPELRNLTAHNAAVRDAVLATPGIADLIEATTTAVRAFLAGPTTGPVAISVGCAGGRHRAATFAAELGNRLPGATVVHRDLAKPVVERGTA